MENNTKCYDYNKLSFNDGILNDSVDATYIIHLKDNGRYDSIQQQLSEYHITNTVYIVVNQGFKKCSKTLTKQNTVHDLIDAYLQVFKHSLEQNYNTILILEDDFIFSEKIKNPVVYKDINNFLVSKKTENFIYYLGCIPYAQTVGLTNHNRVFISGGTHAVMYSKKNREYIISKFKPEQIIDWDCLQSMNSLYYNKYMYYQPLCYQLFPETENKKNWANLFGMINILKAIFKALKLDTQVEPGYSYMYIFSKGVFICLVLLLCLAVYKTVNALVNNKYIKRKVFFQKGIKKQRKQKE
jgi:hypothetical protein